MLYSPKVVVVVLFFIFDRLSLVIGGIIWNSNGKFYVDMLFCV
jgi:hypothetical protein